MSTSDAGESASRDLRNARYCEIIPVTRERNELTSWVYNTLGLNDCPECEWKALTEEQVNQAYGSIAAKLNGPRYWVLNKLVGSGASARPGLIQTPSCATADHETPRPLPMQRPRVLREPHRRRLRHTGPGVRLLPQRDTHTTPQGRPRPTFPCHAVRNGRGHVR